jgi:branched-chain amino acid transport system permease protein
MIWVNDIVQGILTGGMYALFACGLSLMFGVMRVINLAHGDLAVVGGYIALGVLYVTHLTNSSYWWVAALLVVPIMGIIGYVLQRTMIQSALNKGELTTLLVTFGLSVVIENALLEWLTADTRSFGAGTKLITGAFKLGSQVELPYLLLAVFVLAVVVLLGLQVFLSSSRYGRLIRAVADDREAAQMSGANYKHVFGIAAAISFGTVALGGMAWGAADTFVPTTGSSTILLYAFAAVVIGGIGSLWGTLAGGIVLGVAQAVGAQINTSYEVIAGFIVFLVVLVVLPQGLTSLRRSAA